MKKTTLPGQFLALNQRKGLQLGKEWKLFGCVNEAIIMRRLHKRLLSLKQVFIESGPRLFHVAGHLVWFWSLVMWMMHQETGD
jgi:hypothetical protein